MAGFPIVMALSITTTVSWVTVDRGIRVRLSLQVTDETGDIGCHGAFVRDGNVEFDVLVVANASLIRDCSAVDKNIFVRDTAGDDPKPLFVLNHLRVPTSCCASTIIVVVAFL